MGVLALNSVRVLRIANGKRDDKDEIRLVSNSETEREGEREREKKKKYGEIHTVLEL